MAKTEPKDKNTSEEKGVDDLEISAADPAEENEAKAKSDGVWLSKSKIVLAKQLLQNIKENNENLIQLLAAELDPEDEANISIGQFSDDGMRGDQDSANIVGGRVIEGVFDGENMIGPDGKQYSVPANYASKSKLVEGDILKLTITSAGTFVYKQIGPIERNRIIGKLERTNSGNFIVQSGDKKWRVLTASVTYFKGQENDEIIILVPKAGESKWAAVENIVKKQKLRQSR